MTANAGCKSQGLVDFRRRVLARRRTLASFWLKIFLYRSSASIFARQIPD
jgi:hypothetical protein